MSITILALACVPATRGDHPRHTDDEFFGYESVKLIYYIKSLSYYEGTASVAK